MHRTTLMLDEGLFRQLKKEAVSRGQTLKELVNTLLRRALGTAPTRKAYRLNWKTCRGQLQPGVRLDDRESLHDLMEGR